MLDDQKKRRPFRVLTYACLGAAGAVLLYDPSRSLADQSPWIRWVWGAFLLVGAVLAIYGAIRDQWVSEWVGLPLQWAAMGALVFILATSGGSTASIAFALFLGAICTALFGRFIDLSVLAWAALRSAKRGESK